MFQKFDDDKQALKTYLLMQTDVKNRMVYSVASNGNIEKSSFNDMLYKGSSTACQNYAQVELKYLSKSKASSTIDINGDCIPDLVLESTDSSNSKSVLEIYLSTPTGFCLVDIRTLEDDFLMASFADISSIVLRR